MLRPTLRILFRNLTDPDRASIIAWLNANLAPKLAEIATSSPDAKVEAEPKYPHHFRTHYPVGAPTKCTPEVRDGMADAIMRGTRPDDAAVLHGVSVKAWREWMRKGELGKEPYRSFRDTISAAIADVRSRTIRQIRHGKLPNGTPDWRAKAWYLERCFPEELGPRAIVNIQVQKELEGILDKLERVLPTSVFAQVIAAIASDASEGEIGAGEGGAPEPGEE